MRTSRAVLNRWPRRLSARHCRRVISYDSWDRLLPATSSASPTQSRPPYLDLDDKTAEHGQRGAISARPNTEKALPKKDKAIALFEEAIARRPNADAGIAQAVEVFRLTAELAQRMRGSSQIETYKFLKAEVLPVVLGRNWDLPRPLYVRIITLLDQMRQEKKGNYEQISSELPTYTELSRVYTSIGVWNPAVRLESIQHMLEYLCTASTSMDHYESINSYENSLARRKELLEDLLGLWQHISMQKSAILKRDDLEAPLVFDFPRYDARLLVKHLRWKPHSGLMGNPNAIDSLFPQYTRPQLHKLRTTELILATYALLTDPARTDGAAKRKAGPLLHEVAKILRATPLGLAEVDRLYRGMGNLGPYILSQWERVLLDVGSRSKRGGSTSGEPYVQEDRRLGAAADLHKRLSRAFAGRNVDEVKLIWDEIRGDGKFHEEKSAKLRRLAPLFDQIVFIWCALKQNDYLQETTKFMESIGVKITVRTYTSMMEGWRRNKQTALIERLWASLERSNVRLDTAIWTARISALIEGPEPESGIRALNEMGTLWEASKKSGTNNTAVMPTIEPVNAALSGLLRVRGVDAAQEVLRWAVQHGIKADIITFNTLLQPMIREGLQEEAAKLLQVMKSQGIKPDSATVTIVSEGELGQLLDADPEEQVAAVNRLFATMQDLGLVMNAEVYGKAIHTLLRSGDESSDAVKAVLAHMYSRGMEPSPHIYTILVEHYFSRSPPDLEAVRALTAHRGLHETGRVDRTFWESVARGFALSGEVKDALEAFDRTAAWPWSHLASLSVAEALLRLLIEKEEMEAARRVVQRMVDQAPKELKGDARYLKHHFWFLAWENRILSEDVAKALGMGGLLPAR